MPFSIPAPHPARRHWLLAALALGLGLAAGALTLPPAAAAPSGPPPDQCFLEYTGDNVTDESAIVGDAVQFAVNAAPPGALVKVAGYCAGAISQGGQTQTVLITKTLTLQGGYTHTNWLADPDPVIHPTTLDALGQGRVVRVTGAISVTLAGLTFTTGYHASNGGGLYVDSAASVTLHRSRVVGSTTANYGGGIDNRGTLLIADSVVAGNGSGQDGGGLLNWGVLTVTHSAILSNTASDDGGALVNIGQAAFINATVSGNTGLAQTHGVGGGGLYQYQEVDPPLITLLHTTLVSNTSLADSGHALYQVAGSAIISSSLISSEGENCAGVGAVVSGGYNVENADDCGLSATGDLTATVVQLIGPLGENGGPTLTHTLLPGSPAIDRIPPTANDCGLTVTDDQRGMARPAGPDCDSGAFELAALKLFLPLVSR